MLKFKVRYKLNNIARCVLLEALRVERVRVGIELIHGVKVCVAQADDNDGYVKIGRPDHLINGLLQVRDHAISQYQQHVILLIELGHLARFTPVIHLTYNVGEVGRAMQTDSFKSFPIRLLHLLNAVTHWLESVSI